MLFSIDITRSLTRLKSVFVSLHKDYTLAARALMVIAKKWNGSVSPSWPDVKDYTLDLKKS